MPEFDAEFRLILNQTVKVGRRSGYTATAMGDRRPSGETIIAAAMSVYFDFNPGKYSMQPPGNFVRTDYTMLALYNADVQPGDLIYPVTVVTGLTLGRALTVTPIMDFDGHTHHIEVAIERVG